MLFQNCGGGFSAVSANSIKPLSERVELQAEYNTIVGQALNLNDQGLAQAQVELITPIISKIVSADERGVFKINLSSDEYSDLPNQFSIYVKSNSLAPASADYSLDIYNTDPDGEYFDPKYVILNNLKDEYGDVVPLISRVVHLGNSDYGGTANSQFQYPEAEGEVYETEFTTNEEDLLNYESAELIIKARGVQYANKVLIVNLSDASTAAKLGMELTSDGGEVTESHFPMLLDLFKPGQHKISIVASEASTLGDLDDFELVLMEIRFKKRLLYCPVDNSTLLTQNESDPFNSLKLAKSTNDFSPSCLGDLAPIQRSTICMAANIVEANRTSTFDYPDKWHFSLVTNLETIGWPSCFVLNGLKSTIGAQPIVLKSLSSSIVNTTQCNSQLQQTLTPTTTGFANLKDLSFALIKKILSRQKNTPLQLYDDAIQLTGGDSVQAFALIGQVLQHTSVAGVSLKFYVKRFVGYEVNDDYVIDSQLLPIANGLVDSSFATRELAYNDLIAASADGKTTLSPTEISEFWTNYSPIASLHFKVSTDNQSTTYSDAEIELFRKLSRQNHPLLKRLSPVFTGVTKDYYGQFYHFYSFFGLNYIYANDPIEIAPLNNAAWLYEAAAWVYEDDNEDLVTDNSARRLGHHLSCYVKFMEDHRGINWESHFKCNEIRDDMNYQNAQQIPFPTELLSKQDIISKYGYSCYYAFANY